MICHIIFLSRIIHYDLSDYECSDIITNEILRKENLNTKKTIKFITINLVGDILAVLIIFFNFLYWILEEVCDNFVDCFKDLCANFG